MAVSPSPKVTYEEWLTFPEQPRTELIDGEVRLINEPTARHQRTVGRLYFTSSCIFVSTAAARSSCPSTSGWRMIRASLPI